MNKRRAKLKAEAIRKVAESREKQAKQVPPTLKKERAQILREAELLKEQASSIEKQRDESE